MDQGACAGDTMYTRTHNGRKAYMKNYEKKKCFMIGPPRDYHLVEGLDIEVVEDYSNGVDIIINTGPWVMMIFLKIIQTC